MPTDVMTLFRCICLSGRYVINAFKVQKPSEKKEVFSVHFAIKTVIHDVTVSLLLLIQQMSSLHGLQGLPTSRRSIQVMSPNETNMKRSGKSCFLWCRRSNILLNKSRRWQTYLLLVVISIFLDDLAFQPVLVQMCLWVAVSSSSWHFPDRSAATASSAWLSGRARLCFAEL